MTIARSTAPAFSGPSPVVPARPRFKSKTGDTLNLLLEIGYTTLSPMSPVFGA